MALVHNPKNLPKVGDVIKEIKICDDDVAEINFESGKSVSVHLYQPDGNENDKGKPKRAWVRARIPHKVTGDKEVWEPTEEEMDNISRMFKQADADPTGVVVTTIKVSDETYDHMMDMIENPPEPNEHLKEAMAEYKETQGERNDKDDT